MRGAFAFQEEVAEETGYDVPVESLQVIATALSAVGMAGSKQTLFYTELCIALFFHQS